MKKFLATLIILVILGGLAFFFGWAQMSVPPGAYGVLRSKTHGVDPRLVREGEFRWVWYKLIPANAEIQIYRLNPVEHHFTVKNTLPSGETYAAFAGLTADFSYDISADLSFSIRPGSLVSLAADHNIGSQEDLNRLEKSLAADIEAFILRSLEPGGENAGDMEDILGAGASEALESRIEARFPAVEKVSCRVKTAVFPDFALYRQARELSETYLSRQREYLGGGLKEQAENRIESRIRFDELERYGELLAKYPVLLRYLALEKGILLPGDPSGAEN
ncbi:MAG: hypothetical protein LBK27_00850 [Treponema sp.]|jgi:hypothetical protein|nr:hypothetical protein [Treponema sp.]